MPRLLVPTVPNSPLSTREDAQAYGEIALRRNAALNFIENAAFDPGIMRYDGNYQNSQAFSGHFLDHMQNVVQLLKRHFPKNASATEVGCGKGDFLQLLERDGHFAVRGYDATYEGTDPAIEARYLTAADRVDSDLVILRHVLEHVPQPHAFLDMLAGVFGRSTIYIEVPNLDWIIENETFFDITYEHVNYFSPESLANLFAPGAVIEAGLLFEGQYQYVLADLSRLSASFPAEYVDAPWEPVAFDELFPHLQATIERVEAALAGGREGYLWGAATKGCMFLVHCAGRKNLTGNIKFAIDVNPGKCGKFLPGSLVPIVPPADFFANASREGLLIVSNPNYYDEIVYEVSKSRLRDMEVTCL
jgi:hypothetical protein